MQKNNVHVYALLITVFSASFALSARSIAAEKSASIKRPIPANANSARLGDYFSPDQKYVATLVMGEAEVSSLYLSSLISGDANHPSVRHRLMTIRDANGFVWLPSQPHSLVFASSGIYGAAMLAVWRGGRSLRILRPVKHPDSEWFQLDGVLANGKTILYKHALHDEDGGYRRQLHMTIKEPL